MVRLPELFDQKVSGQIIGKFSKSFWTDRERSRENESI